MSASFPQAQAEPFHFGTWLLEQPLWFSLSSEIVDTAMLAAIIVPAAIWAGELTAPAAIEPGRTPLAATEEVRIL